jgi:thymidylate synthase ThyX
LGSRARELLGQDVEKGKGNVRLVSYTPDGDNKLIAALLHSSSLLPFETCEKRAKEFSDEKKRSFLKLAWKHMQFYDFALREFEYMDLQFDLVVSATCFAQLKRHRMATLTTQPYSPELGVTIPPSVEAVGSKAEFLDMIRATDEVYDLLKKKMEAGAGYVLTNSHRKRVLFKVNVRELYHISRLREDLTAQWDIRQVVGEMVRQAKKVMPLACSLMGGKDVYPEIYQRMFGRRPKFSPPKI